MRKLRTIIVNEVGGPAAEFAMVLPLALLFLFGIIDVGRYMWEINRAEKATQMGTRYAVVTNPVAVGLANYDFATQCNIPGGDPIDRTTHFDKAVCTSAAGCAVTATCSGIPSGTGASAYDGTAFTNIADRVRLFKNDVADSQIRITYSNSGIGYAGKPGAANMDVSPIVTVELRNLTFNPLIGPMFGISLGLPNFSYSLTMEDGQGTVSN